MYKLRLLSIMSALAAITATAPAATLSCNNTAGQPNTSLLGYSFDVSVPVNTGGGGSGAGKATTSLVVQFALSPSYPVLYSATIAGRHSSSCLLTETFQNGSTATTTLKDVLFSDLKLLSGNYYTQYTPGPIVQLTLDYDSITIQSN